MLLLQDDKAIGRDIILETHSEQLVRIFETHPAYDALQYPLLFPRGELGLTENIPHLGETTATRQKRVTVKQHTAYRLQMRQEGEELSFSALHRAGRLFQQYVVDMCAKMEQNNLNYLRHNQSQIRSELYQGFFLFFLTVPGLSDALSAGDSNGRNVGVRIVLPSSVKSSPRSMQQLYQDSMAIVRKFGKPDLFITMTCNPGWQEIQDLLLPGQQPHDRPDIVFNQKLKVLCDDLLERNVLGNSYKVLKF